MKPTPRELYYDYKQQALEFYEGYPMLLGITLFYNPHTNYFLDEDGFVVYGIYDLVPPFVIQEYYRLRCPRYFIYDVDPEFQVEIIWDADAWEEFSDVDLDAYASKYFDVR